MAHSRSFERVSARDIPPDTLYAPDRACLGVDPEIFYPPPNLHADPAREICGRCPHRQPCLDWALETEQGHGVWGGTTSDERWWLLQQRKGDAA